MESNNKKRMVFSSKFKRRALIEYSKGRSATEIFKEKFGEIKQNDKKYASKLIHKWKKEFYSERKYIKLNMETFDEEYAKIELLALEIENEEDYIEKEF